MISHQIVCALVLHLLLLLDIWLLELFYRYYFDRCSSELYELVPLPLFCDFSVTIPGYYKDVYVNRFSSDTPRHWNSLPGECFSLTYDLAGFKSRVNRKIFYLGSF